MENSGDETFAFLNSEFSSADFIFFVSKITSSLFESSPPLELISLSPLEAFFIAVEITSPKSISAEKVRTYYYKVRAYKIVDCKNIYAPWSKVTKYKS